MLRTFLLFLFLFVCDAEARPRALRHPDLEGVRSLLWIAAHPDDEILAAPLLGSLCLDRSVVCTMLVLTHGEAGECLRPEGCAPDLGTVRSDEMAQAAAAFHARLIEWSLADGGSASDGSAPGWEAASGGRAALIAQLEEVIAEVDPDVVLTFDPRHGSTCHSDHRATGKLIVESISGMAGAPRLLLLETYLTLASDPFALAFAAADGGRSSSRLDANQSLESTAAPAWNLVPAIMRIHRSQFDARWLAAADAIAPSQRNTWFGDADRLLRRTDVVECR
jgi:LmbE family N-acetylglucosaminyl deacetylase